MKYWIARDKNGALWMYEKAPLFAHGTDEFYCGIGELNSELDKRFFPEITFENSPKEVELKLVK